jgi:hypothetical protein
MLNDTPTSLDPRGGIARLYRRARAKGYPAKVAYSIATAEPAIEMDWQDYDSRATFERDGFTFRVEVEPDDHTDLSWLGEFTDTHEDGAVKNPNHDGSGRTYKWFVPTYTYAERVKDNRAAGCSRGGADERARESIAKDALMAIDYVEYVIALHVEKNEVKLASTYLGGVGFGDDYSENQSYVVEVVSEMLDEAMTEARETLAGLCG